MMKWSLEYVSMCLVLTHTFPRYQLREANLNPCKGFRASHSVPQV